jgi:predicted dehydrogenase
MKPTRYAHVGVGSRGRMYTHAICTTYKDCAGLVAICDRNPGRMALANREIRETGCSAVPEYPPSEFGRMISETRPDTVIVTSGPDSTHAEYIVKALESGCDAITEKPMATNDADCRMILGAVQRTGRRLQVTFNMRYAPPCSQVKEILASGTIGKILSVDFTWPLDTSHGADYYRRWHRRREHSGSLLVHKATHHFDILNWWLDDIPDEVFCHGTQGYYLPETADELGLHDRTDRCLGCPEQDVCPFFLDLTENERLKNLYLDNEEHDGYYRDRCVFSPKIDIWDSMSASIRYSRGTLLNYLLLTYAPWEGYQVAFNGTAGRLEHGMVRFGKDKSREQDGKTGSQHTAAPIQREGDYITVYPHRGEPRGIPVRSGEGTHGGGDPLLLADLFDPQAPPDPLNRKAGPEDGAYSVLTGVAAYKSIDSGQSISIPELMTGRVGN